MDDTPLARNLFAEIVGVSSMGANCSDMSKLNLQRTSGARFNMPYGPETRVFSLIDMMMVYSTYPGVGNKACCLLVVKGTETDYGFGTALSRVVR